MPKALVGILGILVLFLAAWDVRLSKRVRLLEDRLASGTRSAALPANQLPAGESPAGSGAPLASAVAPDRMPTAPRSSPTSRLHDSADSRAELSRSSQAHAPPESVPFGGTVLDASGRKPSLTGAPPGPEADSETSAGRRPGFLGVQGEDAPGGGVKINSIIPYSVASASGLQPGDVIVEVNGTRVDTLASLSTLIRGAGEGAPASLRIRREGVEFFQGVQFGSNAPR